MVDWYRDCRQSKHTCRLQVFDDIAEQGSAGLEKYWDNMDVMSKISQRMSVMDIGPGQGLRSSQVRHLMPCPQVSVARMQSTFSQCLIPLF